MPISSQEEKVEKLLGLFRQLDTAGQTKVINEILKNHTTIGKGEINIEL